MEEVLDLLLAKVTRAEQHIRDFDLGCSAFFSTNPYGIAINENFEPGKRGYIVTKLERPPLTLAAIASDAVQNLSGALDQLAYQIVLRAYGGTIPKRRDKVYFPIFGSAAYYKSTVRGVIHGVRQEVIDAFDATEPYCGGKGHALWVLKQLRNPDQHQLLIAADPYSHSIDIAALIRENFRNLGFELPEFRIAMVPANRKPLKVGDCLYIEPVTNKVDQHPQFTFSISFYQPGVIEGEPAIKTLKELSDLVGGIIRAFAPFLR